MSSPLKAIRKRCLYCMNNQPAEVRKCVSLDCKLFDLRFGKKERSFVGSVIKAIRHYCLDCSAFSPSEVRECFMKDCPLYIYRMGKNPNRSGIGRKNGLFNEKSSSQQRFIELPKRNGAWHSMVYLFGESNCEEHISRN